MISNRKIKKVLEYEGDLFMKERKHEILSDAFLGYATTYLQQSSRPGCSRGKYAFAAAATAAFLLICTFVFMPLLMQNQDSATIDPYSTDSTRAPDSSAPNNSVFEPSLWKGVADTPYAIVKINEITCDSIRLSQNGVMQNYVKILGEVIFSCNTESFNDNGSVFDGGDIREDKATAFDRIEDFYVTENSIAQISGSDTIFICVVKMNMDGRFYYGPATNDEGLSEYLPVVNGRLQIEAEDYETRSFLPLQILNDTLDELEEYFNRGGIETDFTKALPTKKLENGATTDEIIEYFDAWDAAVTVTRDSDSDRPDVPT